jgi:hypothetical protein
MLPNFFVIGAMKSGTTSLHHYLDQHPDVFMSRIKELEFFTEEKNWERGRAWYEEQFPVDAPVRGEASPGYTKHPRFSGIPERMHELVPEARLVYLVRDPIARIVSHYIDSYSFGREHGTLDDALADLDDNHMVNTSRYHMQLSRYLPLYPRDRIMVITTERMQRERAETLRRVYAFLDVDPDFTSAEHERVLYTAGEKTRKTRVGYALNTLAERTRGTKVRRIVPPALGKAMHAFNDRTGRSIAKPTVSPELRERLVAVLADDVARLREFTGDPLEEWSL